MLHHSRGLMAGGILLLATAAATSNQDEMAANPYYKFWAGSRPGASAFHVETTKFSGTATGFGEQAVTNAAITPARSVKPSMRKGVRGAEQDDRRPMNLVELLTPRADVEPSLPRLDIRPG